MKDMQVNRFATLLLFLIGCVGIASAADVGVWSRRGSVGVACRVFSGHVVTAVALEGAAK